MPGTPLGILWKGVRGPPAIFSEKRQGEWSEEKTWKVPLARPCHSIAWSALVRGGGVQTYLAPSRSWVSMSSSVRKRYCGQVSAKTRKPRSCAARICAAAWPAETWAMRIGTSISSDSAIARCVASRSPIGLCALPWYFSRVLPAASSWSVSQRTKSSFSAWIITIAPSRRAKASTSSTW